MLNIGEFARLGRVSPRMLRHYDEMGLLAPARVDPQTGYRCYEVGQLSQLHRLLALRDLGFGLEHIRPLLDEEPSLEQLRGMLRLRRAQIVQDVADDAARLRRVEAHLRALERSSPMPNLDVVIKSTEPVRVAETSGAAPGFGHENLAPEFDRLVPKVLTRLARLGVSPGIMIAWYEEPTDDGSVVLHTGFDLGDQDLAAGDGVAVTDLPVTRVASVIHRGSMDDVGTAYEALVRWIEDSGYALAGFSRELYHEWDNHEPTRSVTELQLPLAG